MNKDTVVGIVGAVILVVAMIGVFKYEGEQGAATLGANAYDVTWATGDSNGPTESGTTALKSKSDKTLTLATTNLTKVQFTLAWKPTNGKDSFKLTVTGPDGEPKPQTVAGDGGSSNSLTLTFDNIQEIPIKAQQFADDETEAQARLAKDHTGRKGTGAWTVTVEFTDATGIQLVPGAPPVQQDQNVAWTLKTITTTYAPKLAKSG